MKVLEENPSMHDLLHSLCPPLMAFFNQLIPLLRQLRFESSKDLEDIKVLPYGMAREFLLMFIEEPIVIGLVNVRDGVVTLDYARRWRLQCPARWLYSNNTVVSTYREFTGNGLLDFGTGWCTTRSLGISTSSLAWGYSNRYSRIGRYSYCAVFYWYHFEISWSGSLIRSLTSEWQRKSMVSRWIRSNENL